ncbi:hypothetical protein BZA05DRAFT_435497 [Tricharina praecox]|uniref:uncharacterized protein n=1 Tax=Tricharina praecox TaxID=43433 RepID=UPI00221F5674|nr:uncharacterized protein BZA05DRAFT_435497 [Tricharina praecox]KAI5853739.1 hypothetical protein BZA05DRAFT_435497 [Tricharina praecox]
MLRISQTDNLHRSEVKEVHVGLGSGAPYAMPSFFLFLFLFLLPFLLPFSCSFFPIKLVEESGSPGEREREREEIHHPWHGQTQHSFQRQEEESGPSLARVETFRRHGALLTANRFYDTGTYGGRMSTQQTLLFTWYIPTKW